MNHKDSLAVKDAQIFAGPRDIIDGSQEIGSKYLFNLSPVVTVQLTRACSFIPECGMFRVARGMERVFTVIEIYIYIYFLFIEMCLY